MEFSYKFISKNTIEERIVQLQQKKSAIAEDIINLFLATGFHDVNSGLKIIKRVCLKNISLHGEFHRYLPLIFYLAGYKVKEVPVLHHKRRQGKSKFRFWRIFPAIFDFFTTVFIYQYGYKPMHFFGIVGGFVFIIGAIINFYLLTLKLQGYSIGGRPLLILGVMLTISGIQFIMTGFLGDLIIRTQEKKSSDKDLLFGCD